MNQYERIVSYIYQYEREEKGANVGYVRLEKRGNECRFFVQIRAVALREVPNVYFYRQKEDGIETIYAGAMAFRGNNMLWKAVSGAERLFQSAWSIEDVDGIFIDGADAIYFATSWKKDYFRLGSWKREGVSEEKVTNSKEDIQEDEPEPEMTQKLLKEEEESKTNECEEVVQIKAAEYQEHTKWEKADEEVASDGEAEADKTNECEEKVQMQSICGVCPFKRKTHDYGKKLLLTFPAMKPFGNGVAKACVRLELQDIGCLPISAWSLSGNRFLLHGYYCYRHLLFAQFINGKYVLGVPGVYSEKERKNAKHFGFTDFQSIGEIGKQQGAFGYWLLELPEAVS